MSDVKCPYCGKKQEINHDDGYGYEEDGDYQQDCVSCEKVFNFTTAISFTHNVYCQDSDYEMEPFGDKWPGMFQCENCDFYEKRT